MNAAQLASIQTLLTDSRPTDDPDNYQRWGEAAAEVAIAEHPEIVRSLVRMELSGMARQRIAREHKRTSDGVARAIADAETGQVSIWMTWTDSAKVRRTGVRNLAEGNQKAALGRRMVQAADCMDAHSGLTARDAWIADGLDPSVLDEATEAIALDEAA